jgi:hypothetical protein
MLQPEKDPQEVKLIRFEYSTEVETGATLVSIDTSISVVEGTDPAPGLVLEGAIVIDNEKLLGLQRVKGGIDGCNYEIRALATDSNGFEHLVVATLPVRTYHD